MIEFTVDELRIIFDDVQTVIDEQECVDEDLALYESIEGKVAKELSNNSSLSKNYYRTIKNKRS